MRTRRAKKTSVFWIFLAIFALVWVALWSMLIGYIYRCLKTYEAAQPERRVEEVMAGLREGSFGEPLGVTPDHSRFEDPAVYRDAYRTLVESGELTYRKAAGSYNAQAPVYDLYAGEAKVASVSLREKSSQPLMFILTLQEWEVASVDPVLGTGELDYTIAIPDSYTLQVNGIPADERERTGEWTELEEFQYAAAYVTVPTLVEYRITGLFQAPDIQVLSPQGVAAELTQRGDGTLAVEHFVTAEMDPALAAFALKNAKDYSNFFSRDLPGATGSISGLRGMFPKDSYYLELAEHYRLYDMWMYSDHQTPVFSNEVVEGYIPYSEDFFSCEVSFDKMMILTRTGEERHDNTHTRFYYVRIDGKWLIADMQQILSQED